MSPLFPIVDGTISPVLVSMEPMIRTLHQNMNLISMLLEKEGFADDPDKLV